MRKPLIALALLLIVASAAIAWYVLRQQQTASEPPVSAATGVIRSDEPAAIAHPIAPPPADQPLPALAESDAPFAEALAMVLDNPSASALLTPNNLIRHIVATVDNLPRRKVPVEQRPLAPLTSQFAADGDEVSGVISAANYTRYDGLVQILASLDVPKAVALYKRFYPLFQRAYQDIGFPDGYFNDRLIAVIDHLLATPSPVEPIRLVRPNVFHEYADPQLEALSAGQKLLIRMGPAHRATVKNRLTALKTELTR